MDGGQAHTARSSTAMILVLLTLATIRMFGWKAVIWDAVVSARGKNPAARRLIGHQTLCWPIHPLVIARTAIGYATRQTTFHTTSRNQPTYPLPANIALRILTGCRREYSREHQCDAECEGQSAKRSAMALQRCLVLRLVSSPVVPSSFLGPRLLEPDDVNHGEDDHPRRVHEMPVERQHVKAVSVLLSDVSQ